MKLNKKEVKALENVLNYMSHDECEHAGGEAVKKHIWSSIRVLYAKIFSEKELVELENSFKN
jgi:hypothetical protein